MKILVLSYLYPPDIIGGYELGCKQAVDGLREQGHEVHVLTSTPRTPVRAEPHVFRRFHLTDVWYNAKRTQSHPAVNQVWEVDAKWFSSHNIHFLIHEIESFQPEVVYVWMLEGVGGLGLIGCLEYLKIPWVWHLMDEVPALLCSNNWKIVPKLAQVFNRLISGHYYVCSHAMQRRMAAKGLVLAGDVELVPNWVVGDRPPARTHFYRSGCLKIVSAGRVTRDKGIDLLVDAAIVLRNRGITDFQIDVYGPIVDGSIPELARQQGLGDLVRFVGTRSQDELASLFTDYDLFAFPTEDREPFGFAPLEAAARGCVPLISEICGIAEWLVHGVHCFKTRRRAESFADFFAEVISGKMVLAAIGRRVQAVVWRDFHLNSVLPAIERGLKLASESSREGAGSSDEVYRIALMAERVAHDLVQEPFCA